MFTRFNDAIVLAARGNFRKRTRRSVIIPPTASIADVVIRCVGSRAALEGQVTIFISNTVIERAKKNELCSAFAADSVVRFNKLRIDDLKLGLEALDNSESLANDPGRRWGLCSPFL